MTEQQLEAYRLMYKALKAAREEIENPGANRRLYGVDIIGHIDAVREHAAKVAPENF